MTSSSSLVCIRLLLILSLSAAALGKIPSSSSSFPPVDEEFEGSAGYEFLEEEGFSGTYTEFLDEYLGVSGEFPLGDFDSEPLDEEDGSTYWEEEEDSEKDDFPLEDIIEEDDIHFVEQNNVKPFDEAKELSTTTSTPKTPSSDEPDSTFLFANRFLFFVLYGAAIMVLFVAILLVICLLIQCRKRRKDSMESLNKARVMGINNSLSKSSKDSIIIDCYRIHKNPLGQKV